MHIIGAFSCSCVIVAVVSDRVPVCVFSGHAPDWHHSASTDATADADGASGGGVRGHGAVGEQRPGL